MSGGVDSSVAASLLKNDGYDVIGVTLEMFQQEKDTSLSTNTSDAKNVCNMLGIPHYIFNVENDFKKYVIQYFISEYELGNTPNPCVICNRYVKFQGLIEKAKDLDIEYISTGHYASVAQRGSRFILKKGIDKKKDQSYFLYNLSQLQLSKSIFPLGELKKEQVREIASELNLPAHEKPDSQEICFVKDNDYKRYLQENSKKDMPKGEFVDTHGNVIGYHSGITNYTIGQRRNLGVSLGKPMYVLDIDVKSNQVVLSSNEQLYSNELIASHLNWISFNDLKEEISAKAKIRYGAKASDCKIQPLGDGHVKVKFNTPQRAITPGQAVVFYDNDYVIGGGTIQ